MYICSYIFSWFMKVEYIVLSASTYVILIKVPTYTYIIVILCFISEMFMKHFHFKFTVVACYQINVLNNLSKKFIVRVSARTLAFKSMVVIYLETHIRLIKC